MTLNRADECRKRADECRLNAGQVGDDMLRGTYLDLARRWRVMAHQVESLEQKEETKEQAGWLEIAKTNLHAIAAAFADRGELGRRSVSKKQA
jgi:hypothetical protein